MSETMAGEKLLSFSTSHATSGEIRMIMSSGSVARPHSPAITTGSLLTGRAFAATTDALKSNDFVGIWIISSG
jgi:hypothetical protein